MVVFSSSFFYFSVMGTNVSFPRKAARKDDAGPVWSPRSAWMPETGYPKGVCEEEIMQQKATEEDKVMQWRSDDAMQEPPRNVMQDFQSSSQMPLLGCRASPRAPEDCTKSDVRSFKSQSALCFPVRHELSGHVTPGIPSSPSFLGRQVASEDVGHDCLEHESEDSVQNFVRPFRTSSMLCFPLQTRVPHQSDPLKSATTTCLPEPASASNPAQYLLNNDGEVQLPDIPVQRFRQDAARRSKKKDNKVLIFRKHLQPRTDSMVRRYTFDPVKATNSEPATSGLDRMECVA